MAGFRRTLARTNCGRDEPAPFAGPASARALGVTSSHATSELAMHNANANERRQRFALRADPNERC